MTQLDDRQTAIAQGARFYMGKPCKAHGHDGTRYTISGACVACTVAWQAAKYDKTKASAARQESRSKARKSAQVDASGALRMTITPRDGEAFHFFAPISGGYIRLERANRPGVMGDQICYGGGFRGNTLTTTGAPLDFVSTCRAWYRAYRRNLRTCY